MRKLVLVVLAVMLLAVPTFAAQTGTTAWHSHSYTDNDSYVDKYSEYQLKQGPALGLGVDAKLYEFDGTVREYGVDSVNVEYKYDIANNNQSVYGVVHVDLWQTGKKLLNK